MKEFKKWDNENKAYLRFEEGFNYCNCYPVCEEHQTLLDNTITCERAKGWRAALKCVKEKVLLHEQNGYIDVSDFMADIDEELG